MAADRENTKILFKGSELHGFRSYENREKADMIYNAYYTQSGIRNNLLELEEYVDDEACDIEDPQMLFIKIYTDRLQIVRFMYDKLKAHLEEKTQENKHKERAEAITEQDLSSLGWKPVEKNIIDAIQKLEAILGEQNHSAQSISILRQIENSWEESSVRLNLNIKALKSNTIETERIVSCDMEEGLLAAMKDILEGQEFSW